MEGGKVATGETSIYTIVSGPSGDTAPMGERQEADWICKKGPTGSGNGHGGIPHSSKLDVHGSLYEYDNRVSKKFTSAAGCPGSGRDGSACVIEKTRRVSTETGKNGVRLIISHRC